MATIPHQNGQETDEPVEERNLPLYMTRLAGETQALNEMHAAARAALINLLCQDPDVAGLFERWTLGTRAGQLCAALGLAQEKLDDLARVAGHDSISTLMDAASGEYITITADTEAEAERIAEELKDALVEWNERQDAAIEALHDIDAAGVFDDAVKLVRDRWQLPWPWQAGELIHLWGHWLLYAVLGHKATITYWVEPLDFDQLAPEISFQTAPGESIGSVMQRCIEEIIEPLAVSLEASRIPSGRRSAPKIVERYVDWWYRKMIRGESVRSIAGKNDDKRKLVKDGIKRAAQWLDVSSWGWKDDTPLGK